jgi:hypothetical protein
MSGNVIDSAPAAINILVKFQISTRLPRKSGQWQGAVTFVVATIRLPAVESSKRDSKI